MQLNTDAVNHKACLLSHAFQAFIVRLRRNSMFLSKSGKTI